MRKKILLLLFLAFIASVNIYAKGEFKQIKVYGNCEQCEERIENAVLGLNGVKLAAWDKGTMILEVKFDTTKVMVEDVEKAVAKVGHDTDHYRATDEAYNQLPACCKYERAPQER